MYTLGCFKQSVEIQRFRYWSGSWRHYFRCPVENVKAGELDTAKLSSYECLKECLLCFWKAILCCSTFYLLLKAPGCMVSTLDVRLFIDTIRVDFVVWNYEYTDQQPEYFIKGHCDPLQMSLKVCSRCCCSSTAFLLC